MKLIAAAILGVMLGFLIILVSEASANPPYKTIVICYEGETIEVPLWKWKHGDYPGATEGPCDEEPPPPPECPPPSVPNPDNPYECIIWECPPGSEPIPDKPGECTEVPPPPPPPPDCEGPLIPDECPPPPPKDKPDKPKPDKPAKPNPRPDAPPVATRGDLPYTGSEAWWWAALGGLMLGVGLTLRWLNSKEEKRR